MERLTVYVQDKQADLLDRISAATGRTRGAVAGALLRANLEAVAAAEEAAKRAAAELGIPVPADGAAGDVAAVLSSPRY